MNRERACWPQITACWDAHYKKALFEHKTINTSQRGRNANSAQLGLLGEFYRKKMNVEVRNCRDDYNLTQAVASSLPQKQILKCRQCFRNADMCHKNRHDIYEI